MFEHLARYIEGAKALVPTVHGTLVPRTYFNNAATALALKPVMKKVNANVPYLTYNDTPSLLGDRNTADYYNVRRILLDYVGADPKEDDAIYVTNSTQGINLLSDLFYQDQPRQVVITTALEHMANYLPYVSKFKTEVAGILPNGDLDLDHLEHLLCCYRGRVKLVAVTGASNVTGVCPPIYEIAALAHHYGAMILVDAVQLVQHQPFYLRGDKTREHIDFVVFSAHKCYTPFDGGTLVGPKEFMARFKPFMEGAGIAKFVSTKKIIYDQPPTRFEPGYPDLFGVMAMGETLTCLKSLGLTNIAAYEKKLYHYLIKKISTVKDIKLYGITCDNIDIPYVAFNIGNFYHKDVAAYLGYERGIEVCSGVNGANIYTQKLLDASDEVAYAQYKKGKPLGVVRASLGMYNTFEEIDHFVSALHDFVDERSKTHVL